MRGKRIGGKGSLQDIYFMRHYFLDILGHDYFISSDNLIFINIFKVRSFMYSECFYLIFYFFVPFTLSLIVKVPSIKPTHVKNIPKKKLCAPFFTFQIMEDIVSKLYSQSS